MVRVTLPLVLLTALLFPAQTATGQVPLNPTHQTAWSEHVRQGVSHFERAFLEFTPQHRDADAAREFDQAIACFERELRDQPSSAVAHAYLGRVHAIRGAHALAARHYDRLSALEPSNVDACVLAALALGRLGDWEGARQRLLEAQGRTSDPQALARLADFLARADRHARTAHEGGGR